MGIKTIIFGSTGMVGEGVLHRCLMSDEIESILVVNRRECEVTHPKLREIIHKDFFNYSAIERELSGYDACFFCLGVSSVGMKEDAYRRITYDLTMTAATVLSKRNPSMTFCYVSGQGTDSSEKGRLMWARVKGRTENDLFKFSFKSAYMFRPGYIKPIKGLKRAYRISRILGSVYPILKFIFPGSVCTLEDLGNAMIYVATRGYTSRILENSDIAAASRATLSS